VGLVWQHIFFHHWDVEGHWKYSIILGLAVWLAYMADRLFDNLSLDKAKRMTRRHQFIRSNWRKIATVWIILFIVAVTFSYVMLTKEEFIGGTWLVILIILYFTLIRISKSIPILGSSKEIITGTLFSIGVSYFPLLSLESPQNLQYLNQVIFAVLCFSNVLLISHWDHAIDLEQQDKNLSQFLDKRETILKILLLGQNCFAFILVITHMDFFSCALMISAISLWILNLKAKYSGPEQLKFLIDAPLILPALMIPLF